MPGKRYSVEQIVAKLREAERLKWTSCRGPVSARIREAQRRFVDAATEHGFNVSSAKPPTTSSPSSLPASDTPASNSPSPPPVTELRNGDRRAPLGRRRWEPHPRTGRRRPRLPRPRRRPDQLLVLAQGPSPARRADGALPGDRHGAATGHPGNTSAGRRPASCRMQPDPTDPGSCGAALCRSTPVPARGRQGSVPPVHRRRPPRGPHRRPSPRDQGRLETVDDVSYLTIDEIAADRFDSDAIERRRARRVELLALDLPDSFVGIPDTWPRRDVEVTTDASEPVMGVPASPGRHTGVARVVRDPSDYRRVEDGDVLVCELTDPGWAPLLAIVGAAVIDIGGPLSHGASPASSAFRASSGPETEPSASPTAPSWWSTATPEPSARPDPPLALASPSPMLPLGPPQMRTLGLRDLIWSTGTSDLRSLDLQFTC
jgi:hypothetical protein